MHTLHACLLSFLSFYLQCQVTLMYFFSVDLSLLTWLGVYTYNPSSLEAEGGGLQV